MISRRNFLALISAVPPVCKAMLANHAEWHRFARELSRILSNLSEKQFLILETKDLYYVVLPRTSKVISNQAISARCKSKKRVLTSLLLLSKH